MKPDNKEWWVSVFSVIGLMVIMTTLFVHFLT